MIRLQRQWLWYLAPCIVINWGQNNSVEGRTKHKLNFFGTVTTVQGKTFPVENISIARMYQNIPVYDVPTKTDSKELAHDPRKGIVTKLDLGEISRLSVSDPNTLWIYKKRKGLREVEYIQITVISKDPQETKRNYLIEVNRKLLCDEKNQAGPLEKVIPLTALDTLTIDGYRYRDDKKENQSNN